MSETGVKSVVIVGGGTAGWMTAAALARTLGGQVSVRLIESDAIGRVGVGEATVPHIALFNNLLGIDEVEFIRKTHGTFKLGIQFNDWLRRGDSYVHGFGTTIGHPLGLMPFHQYWIKANQTGRAKPIGAYSLHTMAAPRNKFMTSASDVSRNSPLADIGYAYHIDAMVYSRYLRDYAEARGVTRTEGKVREVKLRADNGFVESVQLESGEVIAGDLFVDCSGFRGLLIEQALHTGYTDFNDWLPCDRAVVTRSENPGPLPPYTRANAQPAGWQWRIPLQHRTGDGYVYSSAQISDDEATATLLANVEGKTLCDPFILRFTAGMRRKIWNRNVVAIGLSSGFMEPLESTSIHMIQVGITKLLQLFPREGFSPVLIERYNEQIRFDVERIRDFLILHYHATERDDTPFWNHCREMKVPQTLQDNIDLFADSGRYFRNAEELFGELDWVQVFLGQGIMPRSYHPMVDQVPDADLYRFIDGVERTVADCVQAMPTHQAFVDRYCAIEAPA
ncbi:MAG TPA: tryptophan halogenase family protein [Oleiagrimonas sp.]|nr:tryptophan halogenase family protein [Oleiagrimonas sp.]